MLHECPFHKIRPEYRQVGEDGITIGCPKCDTWFTPEKVVEDTYKTPQWAAGRLWERWKGSHVG